MNSTIRSLPRAGVALAAALVAGAMLGRAPEAAAQVIFTPDGRQIEIGAGGGQILVPGGQIPGGPIQGGPIPGGPVQGGQQLGAPPGAVTGPLVQPTIGPPIQPINSASAISQEVFGTLGMVRELPGGRLLVNDGARRRLLLMDSTLQTINVVLDSLTEVSNAYGTQPGVLIPFRGDSTLFVDRSALAVLVIDPQGRVVRIRSVWRTEHVASFGNFTGTTGWPGVDARGRIVYRIPAQTQLPMLPPTDGVPFVQSQPDWAYLVAVDIDTRMVDTLTTIRIPKNEIAFRQNAQGMMMGQSVINPLPAADDWGVLADGRVAVIREIDYRIEYLNPDGTWTSSEKLPFDWRRLTDDDKEAMVDSLATVRGRTAAVNYLTAMIRWVNLYGQQYPEGLQVPDGYALPPGLPEGWRLPAGLTFPGTYVHGCPAGVEPTVTPAPGGAGPGVPSCIPQPVQVPSSTVPAPPTRALVQVISPTDLPDYRPPLPTANAARGDADGNLWIQTVPATPIPGGLVYDIVSPDGELVSRYQLPPGYAIVGFGEGKVVYLSMRDQTGLKLARVRLR